MGSDEPSNGQSSGGEHIGTLEDLFDKLGTMRKEPCKGDVLLVLRATCAASNAAQLRALADDLGSIFKTMTAKARGLCYRLHGLDYAFLLNNSSEDAREFLPNARIALFKVLSRSGAGQSSADGQGPTFEHFNLESDFSSAAKFVVSYIKNARESKSAHAEDDGARILTEKDLKAVITAYRQFGAEKFLRKFARGQPICVSTDRGELRPKMTEYYISIDSLKKPFFNGADLTASGDRFVELTKILDTIMLNAFPTLYKAAEDKRISLNLNVQSVFSKAFDTFIEKTPQEVLHKVTIEFRQEDAVINYDGYAIAREHLRKKGAQIAIDQITPSAIGLVNIAFLDAQIAKLNWSTDSEEDLYSRQDIVDRFRRNGIQPVLSHVDQERGHDVGKDLGIEMYQGFLIDDMLKSESRRVREAMRA